MNRLTLLLVVLLLAFIGLGLTYCKGGSKGRSDVATLRTEAKATAVSTDISRDTAGRVDVQGAETRERTRAAQETIRERIEAAPRPAAGADPAILRVAQEAHVRAIRAACRVQRTSDCTPAATAPR
ncbi:MAG TPA: hypothetical protein VIT90_15330 [Lysobacter sp.]